MPGGRGTVNEGHDLNGHLYLELDAIEGRRLLPCTHLRGTPICKYDLTDLSLPCTIIVRLRENDALSLSFQSAIASPIQRRRTPGNPFGAQQPPLYGSRLGPQPSLYAEF